MLFIIILLCDGKMLNTRNYFQDDFYIDLPRANAARGTEGYVIRIEKKKILVRDMLVTVKWIKYLTQRITRAAVSSAYRGPRISAFVCLAYQVYSTCTIYYNRHNHKNKHRVEQYFFPKLIYILLYYAMILFLYVVIIVIVDRHHYRPHHNNL